MNQNEIKLYMAVKISTTAEGKYNHETKNWGKVEDIYQSLASKEVIAEVCFASTGNLELIRIADLELV